MSNKQKAILLGMPLGTATGRLRKTVLFSILQETGKDSCFRCGQVIGHVDDLSMEHKQPWQTAEDPKAVFFDVGNIAFSHLSCNSGAAAHVVKTHCPQGHPYDETNTYYYPAGWRGCRTCRFESGREFRKRHPEQDTSEYRRQKGWRS